MSNEDHQLEIPISQETAVEQRIIPFEGDELTAALAPNGRIYVSLPGICRALGINRPQNQVQRIARTRPLARGLRQIPLKAANGGTYPTYCLQLDRVALWLAGIETERLKPEFQGKIEAYQDELAEVATQIFFQHMGMPANPPLERQLTDLIVRLEQQETTLETVVRLLERIAAQTDHAVELLELLTAKLTPAQKDAVQKAVGIIVEQSAGKPGEMTYAQIYAALKRRFQVGSYSEIAPERFEEALSYLREMWKRVTAGSVPDQQPLMS